MRANDVGWKENWRHYFIIGIVNSAVPFLLYSFAALHIPASFSVILNAYSSCERGTNENLNGLIRQYSPKKTDFSKVTPIQVRHVEWLLINRPRKELNYFDPI